MNLRETFLSHRRNQSCFQRTKERRWSKSHVEVNGESQKPPSQLNRKPYPAAQMPRVQTGFSQKLRDATEVIVELKGGEGGDDSKLFVHDLFAGIVRFANRNGLKIEIVSEVRGHVTAECKGANAWQLLEPLIGTHCVQRVPPTETKGRRHTSYLAVAVLPVIRQLHRPLDMSEVIVKCQGGHGPGGQHQNKSDSAVRMTHVSTGIQVFINGRSQHANRETALRILTARVRDHEQQKADDRYRKIRKSQMGNAGRGTKIRTYNYLNDRAVDHRTGARAKVRRVIEKGEFELLD